MKSILGKVMRVGRATVFLIGLVVVFAAVFTVAPMTFAANGKPLLLGRNNVATAITTLVKQGAGPALSLHVGSGPPLAVNSKAPVANLNADLVDGKDAGAFLPRNGKAADADRLDNKRVQDLSRVAWMDTGNITELPIGSDYITYGQPLSITAPAPGFVRVNGSVTASNTGCTSGCAFLGEVRHVNTGKHSYPAVDEVTTTFGNVSLDGVFPVTAGVNTFDIRLFRFNGNGTIYGRWGTLTAEYTPYDRQGKPYVP